MKFNCKHCNEVIEITQSERAKHGLKKLYDHEAECFKKKHASEIEILNQVNLYNMFPDTVAQSPKVTDKHDMQGIIAYLHTGLGRIPTEDEVLRFHMFLQTAKPNARECQDFVKILKALRR